MISFAPTTVASQAEIDAQRAQLAPWLWPVRVAMLVCYALSFYVAFFGSKDIVPLLGEYFYGPDWWPSTDSPLILLSVMAIALWHIGVFALIAFPLLHGINYVGHTFVLGPYWRISALADADVSEAARLADSAPVVESYRAAVAQQRGFVVGDLELMRELAEQARVVACEKKLQAIQAAAQKRLHGDGSRLNGTSQSS